jgi:plasmid stabilization system protein ParE
MEYQIKLKPSAEKDIEDITDYYFVISENLGLKFYFEFKESIENLKIYPKFQV